MRASQATNSEARTPATSAAPVVWSRRWRRVCLLLLVGYVVVLGLLVSDPLRRGNVARPPLWDFQRTENVVVFLTRWATVVALSALRVLPVGVLAVLAAAPLGRRRARRRAGPVGLVVAMAAAVLFDVLDGSHLIRSPHLWHLIIPGFGALVGVWIGMTWLRGRRARIWIVPKLVLAMLVIALAVGLVAGRLLAAKPLPFAPAVVDSEHKAALVRYLRARSPRHLADGETRTVQLTNADLNLLLAWGLSLGSADRKAHVEMNVGGFAFSASVGVPLPLIGVRYVNIDGAARAELVDDHIHVVVHRARIGGLTLPPALVEDAAGMVLAMLRDDENAAPILRAVREIRYEPDLVSVTYGGVDLPSDWREDVFGPLGPGQEVIEAVRTYIRTIVAIGEHYPPGRVPFGACMEAVFDLAKRRSATSDPVLENRAAIIALGIMLGHGRIAEFVGPVLDDINIDWRLWRSLRWMPIRGRADWTRHFTVSAALAVLSTESVSDAAGLLKEELDAGHGGSGFSFGDLLADRSGTMFGLVATKDAAGARAIQDRIAAGFDLDAFFPSGEGLPERIPMEQFESTYGGVEGARYKKLVSEIDRRVAACAAYR